MLRVCICPKCKGVRPVARRKEVKCYQCDSDMTRLNLTYSEFAQWDLDERKVFIDQWYEKFTANKNNQLDESGSRLFTEL